MRKTIAKAVTWRVIGTTELFVISLWTTGHIATAGHTAGIAAIASFLTYVAHELAWNGSFSRAWGEAVATLPPRLMLNEVSLVVASMGKLVQTLDSLGLDRCDPPLAKSLPTEYEEQLDE